MIQREEKVTEAANRAAEQALLNTTKNARQAHLEAGRVGRLQSLAHYQHISNACVDGFTAIATTIMQKIIEFDQSNTETYADFYSQQLQLSIPKLIIIFRDQTGLNGKPRIPADGAKEVQIELEQKLATAHQNAVDEHNLTVSIPEQTSHDGLSDHDLKMAILHHHMTETKANKHNVLGRPNQTGPLEKLLGKILTASERSRAAICFDELIENGLLMSNFTDIAAPQDWLYITDAGRDAVKRGALDELGAALFSLGGIRLVNLRNGAWAATFSAHPDADRQAAHSGRELITQVLDAVAPLAEIRNSPGYQPSTNANSGVTRKMRFKHAVKKRSSGMSDSDIVILNNAADLLDALYAKLSAKAHERNSNVKQNISAYLKTTEMVLNLLLI